MILAPLLPIPRGKKGPPFFDDWQHKTADDLDDLFLKYPGCNRGLRLDRYVQVDADNEAAVKAVKELQAERVLPPTLTYITWRGVETPLYKAPPGLKSFDIKTDGLNLQIRTGPGHYALIPDSVFKGKPYAWAKHLGPADVDVVTLPAEGLARLRGLDNINNKNTYSRGTSKGVVSNGCIDFTKGHRDNSLFHVATKLTQAGMAEADIVQVLTILAKNCNPPFPEKELLSKILSAERRKLGRERSIAEEVREWILLTNDNWLLTNCYQDLRLITRANKMAAIMEVQRLEKAGRIEKCSEKRGCYRTVDNLAEDLEWWTADTKNTLDLRLPLDLHKAVKFYPKSVVVVAGTTDAGKTAFLLNVALKNLERFKINYFSSEMPIEELKDRLEKFQEQGLISNLDIWRKVSFKSRVSNFHQVIKPNEVNIIDYLEITRDPFIIADLIKSIYNKLEKGIAIIAIQKHPDRDMGMGGIFSQFQARLYISMDKNKIRLTKAKLAKDPEGHMPSKVYGYKLIQGAKFIPHEK
jgi:hypothetical protein